MKVEKMNSKETENKEVTEREVVVKALSQSLVSDLMQHLKTKFRIKAEKHSLGNRFDLEIMKAIDSDYLYSQQDEYESKPKPEPTANTETSSETKCEKSVPAFKIGEVLAKLRKQQPFVPHPVSLGFDAVQTAYALEERKKLQKRNKKRKDKDLPPLHTLIRPKKSILCNFVSPVPPNYVIKRRVFPTKDVSQVEEISSSTKEKGEPIEEQQLTPEQLKTASYLIFLKSPCLDYITKVEGCNGTGCAHEVPDPLELENMLDGNTGDTVDMYQLVKKFKPELRTQYFPVLARLFAKKNRPDDLKTMLGDISAMTPFLGFGFVHEAMVLHGWSPSDAVQFVIDNHKETAQNQEKVRKDIIRLIGSVKEDVVKFLKYLCMVSNAAK